jgi:hypothetical protein
LNKRDDIGEERSNLGQADIVVPQHLPAPGLAIEVAVERFDEELVRVTECAVHALAADLEMLFKVAQRRFGVPFRQK